MDAEITYLAKVGITLFLDVGANIGMAGGLHRLNHCQLALHRLTATRGAGYQEPAEFCILI